MLKDSTILITGGTGSLGMALVPELLKHEPHAIRLMSNSENELYEAVKRINNRVIRPLIGDIKDRDRLAIVMSGVDYVIHAAALKHIDICEYSPMEAIKVNIIGALNIVDCAIQMGVKKCLGISSDKAVYPINIYGATKLVMEKLFIHSGSYAKCKFSCIRAGNFIASRGSFLEMVDKSLHDGTPIKVTDKNMDRYWIPLDKIAGFTVRCLAMMEGGEIFVPKMGHETIGDILERLAPNHLVEIIGKRHGEKMSEVLFCENEAPKDCGDYYVLKELA